MKIERFRSDVNNIACEKANFEEPKISDVKKAQAEKKVRLADRLIFANNEIVEVRSTCAHQFGSNVYRDLYRIVK